MQNLKLDFIVIHEFFSCECHSQTSFKVAFIMLGVGFIKFSKLESLQQEKKLDFHKI